MQNNVLLGIILALMNKPYTAQALAKKFELSVRSIYRYIDVLESAEIPVLRERGYNGGYSIMPGFMLDNNFFNSDEYTYLTDLLQSVDLPINKNVHESVVDKIFALRKSREFADGNLLNTSDFFIDGTNWTGDSRLKHKLDLMTFALREKKLLTITYIDSDLQNTKREIEPHTLVLKSGAWYIYAFCRFRNEFRLFSLSRIIECAPLNTCFERRTFSPDSVPWKVLAENSKQTEITVEFSDAVKHLVEEWLGFDSISNAYAKKPPRISSLKKHEHVIAQNPTNSDAITAQNTTNNNPLIENDANNIRYTAKQKVNLNSFIISKILSFGSQLTVLSPQSLIETIKSESAKIQKNYNNQSTAAD